MIKKKKILFLRVYLSGYPPSSLRKPLLVSNLILWKVVFFRSFCFSSFSVKWFVAFSLYKKKIIIMYKVRKRNFLINPVYR